MASTLKPKTEYEAELKDFSGGLNLRDADYCMGTDESPEMKNMLWRNGFLASRKGQALLGSLSGETGTGHALYNGVWHGHLFAHIGEKLYAVCIADGTYTALAVIYQEVPGTFFMYDGALYYKSYAVYKKITATEVAAGWQFVCTSVVPYVPVIVMNASYADGSGDLYQPENRYSPLKTVWFNAASGITSFKLPVVAEYIQKVVVDGVQRLSGWTYNSTTGVVTFSVAPPVTTPPTNNTVRITYSKSNLTAYNSVNFARYAAVSGGDGELCVVMAGSELQRNVYFWSGNSDVAMDPGYFPMEQYQIAGETENPITGFGRQQSNLIVFQETAIGKAGLGIVELNGRNSIEMPYTPINAKIGCDKPWTIQLVENDLTWATSGGVYRLLDTTEANENFLVCISGKINGTPPEAGAESSPLRAGLIYDLSQSEEDRVCAADDGRRYWLLCNGHAWVWDYEMSTYKDPSWFYMDGIGGVSVASGRTGGNGDVSAGNGGTGGNGSASAGYGSAGGNGGSDELYQLLADGSTARFQEAYNDFGNAFERVFRTAVLTFGELDRLKTVNSVIFCLSGDRETQTTVEYLTDYGDRIMPDDLKVVPAAEYFTEKIPGTRPVNTTQMAVFRRRPMCRRIMHFAVRLSDSNENEDMSVVGIRVYYEKLGRLR